MKRRDGTGKQSRSGKRPGAFQMRERLKQSPEKALEEERRNWNRRYNMAELVKVAFLGIAGVLLAVQFRGAKPEYATYIGLGASIVIFCFCMRQVEFVTEQFSRIKVYLNGGEGYLSILLKVIGITYVCEFSSGVCRDAGYQAVAGQIEVLGKLTVMFAGLPILFAVIEQIHGFL